MVYYGPAHLTTTLSALADPTRRAIVDRLSRGESTISELARPFDMSLPAVSKHIRVLENAGLLRQRRVGRARHCRLVGKPMGEIVRWLHRYEESWNRRLDALAQLVEEDEA